MKCGEEYVKDRLHGKRYFYQLLDSLDTRRSRRSSCSLSAAECWRRLKILNGVC